MKILNQEFLAKIDKFIEENKQNCLDELMDLVRVPSVRGEAVEGAPFGIENRRLLEETKKLYEKHGFKTEIEKDGYYSLSYSENEGKTIGIFSHGDVVPPDGEWLVCPPFEPIIKDGYMFGRGCNDDKSGMIEALYAAKFFKEYCPEFKSRIVMFTGSNEESGMEDIKKFVENEQMPDFSISPDGEYPFYGAERSIIRLFAESIVSTYEEVTGDLGKKPIFTSGGTYSRMLKNSYSIGTINYKVAKPIELPQGHGGCHQPDEKLNINGFLNAIKILICILIEADAILNR